MTNDQLILPPHSQHFRCLPQLIKSVAIRCVYIFLFDEHLMKSRSNENTAIPLSYSRIAYLAGVNRKYVSDYLDALSKMGLITISSKSIKVNAEVIYGLTVTYQNIDKDRQNDFILALESGDYAMLRKLGYKERSAQSMLYLLSGSPYHESNNATNVTNETNVANGINVTDKNCDKCHKTEKNETNVAILSDEDYEIAEFYAQIIATNVTKRTFRRDFLDLIATNVTTDMVEEFIDAVFETNVAVIRKYWTKFGHILVLLTCDICRNSDVTFVANGCDICRTVNKEENKLKNKLRKILKNFSGEEKIFEEEQEEFYQDEEQETSSYEIKEESQDHDETSSKEENNFVPIHLSKVFSDRHRRLSRKDNLPFLPAEEVKEWISDIRNCIDRSDKLLLYYIYEIGHELFDREEVVDEEGNIISEANTDTEHWQIYDDRIMQDLITPAMDSMKETIKAEKVMVNGEELPVTAKDDLDIDVLLDWDKATASTNGKKWLYLIRMNRYRNIYADEVPVLSKVVTLEDKKRKIDDNNVYAHKLILLAQFDDTYEQLTLVEKNIYNFFDEFFILDDDTLAPVDIIEQSTVFSLRHTALSQTIARYKISRMIKPMVWDELTEFFYGTKTDEHGCLPLDKRMFDAEKIRRYHALHNLTSIVDDADIDELLERLKAERQVG